MIFRVRMIAFHDLENGQVAIREVDVPDEKLTGELEHDLGLVYHYGQNDFQPVANRCSVSVADVIEYNGELYAVAPVGFKKLTNEEYELLLKEDRRDRSWHSLIRGD